MQLKKGGRVRVIMNDLYIYTHMLMIIIVKSGSVYTVENVQTVAVHWTI